MITIQDLIDRFGEKELAELTDREHYEVIDEAVINSAISDAEGEVEGYLNAVGLVSRNNRDRLIYLDDQPPPKALILKTCDIARYYLYEDKLTEVVEKRYESAIKWLDKVMKHPTMLTGIPKEPTANDNQSSGVCVIPNPKPSSWID